MQPKALNRFQGKVVVMVGSTGGLGSAFARALAAEGAQLVLVGRPAQTFLADVTDAASLDALRGFARETFGSVNVVVNAAGVDVRQPFEQHTASDFRRTLDVNLIGAMLLTQAFLPLLREQNNGMIVHVGGFADGRLAFPYHSANVAARAGLFSFVEALNRELALEGSRALIAYFSPSAADTEAERPFHPIWREMGLSIQPTEKVAASLLRMIEKRQPVHLMGGPSTAWFAKLNSIWPRLADAVLLNRYGRILQRFLSAERRAPSRPRAKIAAVEMDRPQPHRAVFLAVRRFVGASFSPPRRSRRAGPVAGVGDIGRSHVLDWRLDHGQGGHRALQAVS